MVVNNAEDNHNLYTRNNLFVGEITISEVVYLFLEDVLAMVRFSNSALNDPFTKGIPLLLQPSNNVILATALCWRFLKEDIMIRSTVHHDN
jgi:hypothetical protein